jgi:hypothetical protein
MTMGVKEPAQMDVLLGRGRGHLDQPGNKHFRELINSYAPSYNATESKHSKSKIVAQIMSEVLKQGVFRKYDKPTGLWMPVNDEEAKDKTGHAMRYKYRRQLNELKKSGLAIDAAKMADNEMPQTPDHEAPKTAEVDLKETPKKDHKINAAYLNDSALKMYEGYHHGGEYLMEMNPHETPPEPIAIDRKIFDLEGATSFLDHKDLSGYGIFAPYFNNYEANPYFEYRHYQL